MRIRKYYHRVQAMCQDSCILFDYLLHGIHIENHYQETPLDFCEWKPENWVSYTFFIEIVNKLIELMNFAWNFSIDVSFITIASEMALDGAKKILYLVNHKEKRSSFLESYFYVNFENNFKPGVIYSCWFDFQGTYRSRHLSPFL